MSKPTCCICKTSEDDQHNLGEMKIHKGYTAHYYCLLLSSTIQQTGDDDEGILGFRPSDITSELKRSKKRICTYCKKRGASVLCGEKSCKVMFHLPCGIKNRSGHQFYGTFVSYCVDHRPRQKYPEPSKDQLCNICYEQLDSEWPDILWGSCCKKNSFFHKLCVQKMASNAGYFCRCPLCNNEQIFQSTMKHYGVFIPDRDASWELVPNAYEELLYRHDECNVENCLCPKGRKYTNAGGWYMSLCDSCGSQGTHIACSKIKKNDIWICTVCTPSNEPTPPNSAAASSSNSGTNGVIDFNRPSTSRGLPNATSSGLLSVSTPSVSSISFNSPNASIPSSSNSIPSYESTSRRSRKRKRCSSVAKSEPKPSTSNTPSTWNYMAANENDSDSDVVVIEEDDQPAVKCLLAQDGSVLPVRTISSQDINFSVQGDLNIKEVNVKPKTQDSPMNFVITNVRSLKEPSNETDNDKSPTETESRQGRNQPNNYTVYPPVADSRSAKNSPVSVIDTRGNIYILKEIMGYHLFTNNRVGLDQSNQNAGNMNNALDSDIVVID